MVKKHKIVSVPDTKKDRNLHSHSGSIEKIIIMIIQTFQTLFKRDLDKVQLEIESYKNEERIWYIEKSIANSGGNLCLHLIGNLNAYIGVGLANTDYVRFRDLEFSLKNVPRTELIQKLEATKKIVAQGLSKLTAERLPDEFPLTIWEKPTEMEYTLVHILTHINYHLGQINYHRRLLDQ